MAPGVGGHGLLPKGPNARSVAYLVKRRVKIKPGIAKKKCYK